MAFTKQQFHELYKLNPDGDPGEMYKYIDRHMFEDGTVVLTSYTKEKVTFDYLLKKYKEYILWWDHIYGKRDQNYVAQADKKKNIKQFCADRMYERNFIIGKKERDNYLFGDISDSYLMDRITDFESKIGVKKNDRKENTSTEIVTAAEEDMPF